MTRRTKQVGIILGLLAIVVFAGWRPIARWLTVNSASASMQERTKALVERNPQLQPAWDTAMQDDVLTELEAKEILEQGGEKVEAAE